MHTCHNCLSVCQVLTNITLATNIQEKSTTSKEMTIYLDDLE